MLSAGNNHPRPSLQGAPLTAILGDFTICESLACIFVHEPRPTMWMGGYQYASGNWLFIIVYIELLMVAPFLLSMIERMIKRRCEYTI